MLPLYAHGLLDSLVYMGVFKFPVPPCISFPNPFHSSLSLSCLKPGSLLQAAVFHTFAFKCFQHKLPRSSPSPGNALSRMEQRGTFVQFPEGVAREVETYNHIAWKMRFVFLLLALTTCMRVADCRPHGHFYCCLFFFME